MFPVTAGQDQSNSLNSGTFLYISGPPGGNPSFMDTHGNSGTLARSAYTFKERNNINSLQKKNIYRKFGGAMAPVPPPPGYATGCNPPLNFHKIVVIRVAVMIYCITLYFRGKKISRKVNLKYFREKIFSRIYCSRENFFQRKYLPAKISCRENILSRKYLPAKIILFYFPANFCHAANL